jgi:hypothetical protein
MPVFLRWDASANAQDCSFENVNEAMDAVFEVYRDAVVVPGNALNDKGDIRDYDVFSSEFAKERGERRIATIEAS